MIRTGEPNHKYRLIAERLSQQIRNGDYHLHGVPAERKLASQVGVSYMTVRKAIQLLLDRGLLTRLPSGRLAVSSGDEMGVGRKQVALLAPAWESNDAMLWNIGLSQLQGRMAFGSRMVHYVHWDDPVIVNTIQQFDATLLLPPEPPGEDFASKLSALGRPLVVLNRDWSDVGVRSVQLMPPRLIQKLLDHLASLGHRRVDCFNVQPCRLTMREWIGQWEVWRAAHHIDGELINEPVEPYTETLVAAYNVMARRIGEGRFDSKALFCLTETAAIGAVRAMIDHGIRPGHDVAVCTIGSQRCEYLPLTITTLEQPDRMPYLAACMEWALEPGRGKWQGPLLIEPQDLTVVVRESTVPDIRQTSVPQRMQSITPCTRRVDRSVDESTTASNV